MKLRVRILSNEKGTYTAVCTSLPGCTCEAATREAAREKLDEAIRGYIAAVSNFVPENLVQEVVEA